MTLRTGQVLGHYTLQHRLGAGGMAEVWAARHGLLGTEVAIKVLFQGSPDHQARLLREGRAQASIDHPHVLPVRDVLEVDGAIGLVLPWVRGPALDRLLQHHRPTEEEAAALFRAILDGVGHAHGRGLVHRDLKPANVLLDLQETRVVPRISDFGLVRDLGGPRHTQTGAMMGTLSYASPEQVRDASSVTPAADLFSLGVLLSELLAGALPFPAHSLGMLLDAHAAGPDLSRVPARWTPLVRWLLQPDPADRPADVQQIYDALEVLSPPSGHDPLALEGPLGVAIRAMPANVPTSGSRAPDSLSFAQTMDLASLPPQHNLPPARDPFVGRQDALARLHGLLTGEGRLVTLVGPGGTGKTRLALEHGREALGANPGGVYFCDLAEARTAETVLRAVAHALEVPLGHDDLAAQVGHAIEGRGRCLLILDNLEQVAGLAVPLLETWRRAAHQANFLLTTREVLGVAGETLLPLDPLDEDAAVELFVHRAGAVRPSLPDDEATQTATRELVRLLDHLPLAIELAAARARVLTPQKLLARMNHRFRLLAAPGATTDRHGTLRATLDWSWDLLEPWEQHALAQLSVFEGGWTLEAAEEVLDLGDVDVWPLDAVQALVDKSLVRVLGQDRFGMLVSVHAYAAERLRDAPDPTAGPQAQERHGAFFARLAPVRRTAAQQATAALAADLDNLLAACRRAVAAGDGPIAAQTALAAWQVLSLRGPFSTGLALLEQALPLGHDEARLRLAAGQAQQLLGSAATAETHLRQALALARQHADPATEAQALRNLGTVRQQRGEVDEARTLFEQALDDFLALEDPHGQAQVWCNLGTLHRLQGRMDQALTAYETSLTLSRDADDVRGEGNVLTNLALLHKQRGRPDQALVRYQQALSLFRELGDRRSEGMVLGNLGILHKQQGRLGEALSCYTRSLAIHRAVGNRRSEGLDLGNLGNLHQQQGRPEEALSCFERSLRLQQQTGNHRFAAQVLVCLGDLHQDQGRPDDARDHYDKALPLFRALGARRTEGHLLGQLGHLRTEAGEPHEALPLLAEAEQTLRALQDQELLAVVRCHQAVAAHHTGDTVSAKAALAEAQQIAETLHVGSEAQLSGVLRAAKDLLQG